MARATLQVGLTGALHHHEVGTDLGDVDDPDRRAIRWRGDRRLDRREGYRRGGDSGETSPGVGTGTWWVRSCWLNCCRSAFWWPWAMRPVPHNS